MVIRRLFASAYFGFALFIVLSLFYGKGGLSDFTSDLKYKEGLEANIRELERINRNLTLELKAVSSSPDTIRVFARDYGYYERGEEVIKIQGAPSAKNYSHIGSLLRRTRREEASGYLFHIIGLAGAAVAFVFSMALLRPRPRTP